eukprot:XP_001709773.1 Hypothetical protein GL50803_34307 [Giardia lamblia ATCC 50803]
MLSSTPDFRRVGVPLDFAEAGRCPRGESELLVVAFREVSLSDESIATWMLSLLGKDTTSMDAGLETASMSDRRKWELASASLEGDSCTV